jgi:hypothetical protein
MTDADLLSRVRKVESSIEQLISIIAELERGGKRDYHDAPAYRSKRTEHNYIRDKAEGCGKVIPRDRPEISEAQDGLSNIDAMLDRGVTELRASGRLEIEDDAADRALVLAILDAVMPASLQTDQNIKDSR